jgi:acyl-[acyl-carrier-protein]-phospholipid O-acyltransferase/long-chain-fatty-acid--[acyl-carrier-protein] ligase
MVSLGLVEQQVRVVLGDEADLVAVNLPEGQKGEQIVLLTTAETSEKELRESLLTKGSNPLTIPAHVFVVDAVPVLGSGKPDFASSKKLAQERLANLS